MNYTYNKRTKDSTLVTIVYSVVSITTGLYVGYRLFMWGFESGAWLR